MIITIGAHSDCAQVESLDAGVQSDASFVFDAAVWDSGRSADVVLGVDASLIDANGSDDAAVDASLDAASPMDAATPADAGLSSDATGAIDAATTVDAAVTVDAGPVDSGADPILALEDYAYTYWPTNFRPGGALATVRHFHTGFFALAFDASQAGLTKLGSVQPGVADHEALEHDASVVGMMDSASAQYSVDVDGQPFAATGFAGSDGDTGNPSQLVDGGRFMQRIDARRSRLHAHHVPWAASVRRLATRTAYGHHLDAS